MATVLVDIPHAVDREQKAAESNDRHPKRHPKTSGQARTTCNSLSPRGLGKQPALLPQVLCKPASAIRTYLGVNFYKTSTKTPVKNNLPAGFIIPCVAVFAWRQVAYIVLQETQCHFGGEYLSYFLYLAKKLDG